MCGERGNGRSNKVPGGKGRRRTTVGGRANAKYEVEIWRNSVAQGGGGKTETKRGNQIDAIVRWIPFRCAERL